MSEYYYSDRRRQEEDRDDPFSPDERKRVEGAWRQEDEDEVADEAIWKEFMKNVNPTASSSPAPCPDPMQVE